MPGSRSLRNPPTTTPCSDRCADSIGDGVVSKPGSHTKGGPGSRLPRQRSPSDKDAEHAELESSAPLGGSAEGVRRGKRFSRGKFPGTAWYWYQPPQPFPGETRLCRSITRSSSPVSYSFHIMPSTPGPACRFNARKLSRKIHSHMVKQGGEPFLPPFLSCLSHTAQSLGHSSTAIPAGEH
jgi:hypothetical protein